MLALLSKALIVLMIVLLLPTGLVFASQNAVPGDMTYPVKRGLENVIVTAASLHPSTRAFFKTDMAGRRYKEAVALIRRGDVGSAQSLQELVLQTESAALDISQISDLSAKEQLADNLSKQIEGYKIGLSKLETSAVASQPVVSQPIAQAVVSSAPTPLLAPPAAAPPAQQQPPIQSGASAQPTAPPAQSAPPPPPTAPPVQSPVPPQRSPGLPANIGQAIDDLEKVKDRLEQINKEIEKNKNNKNKGVGENKSKSRDDEVEQGEDSD